MAKVLKRIGTLSHKFAVDIVVHSLQMSLSLPIKVAIVWKRRNKRIETSGRPDLLPTQGSVEIEETLTMINTLYQKKAGNYMEKKADLTVQAIVEGKGSKSIGGLKLNIADYATAALQRQTFKLEKSPDRYSSITISVRCRGLGEPSVISDNMSDASGDSGASYGTEGDYSGPPLFEQDLTGFEEETKVLMGSGGRPPALIKGKQEQKPKRMEPQAQEMLAQLSILEREKASLQSQKDELQASYAGLVESTRKDREKLLEHITSQDTQLEEVSSLTDSYKSQLEAAEEDNRKLAQSKKELQAVVKKLEMTVNEQKEDCFGLREENERLKRCVEMLEEKGKGLQRRMNEAISEKTKLESSLIEAQSEVETLQHALNQQGQGSAADSALKRQLEVVKTEMEKREKLLNEAVIEAKAELERAEMGNARKQAELTVQLTTLKGKLQQECDRADREQAAREKLESQITAESEDFTSKVNRMTINMKQVQSQRDQLEETLTRRFRAPEPENSTVLAGKIEELEAQVARQRDVITQLESDLTNTFEEK